MRPFAVQTAPATLLIATCPDLIELLKQPGGNAPATRSAADLYRDLNSPQVVPYLNKATDTVTGVVSTKAKSVANPIAAGHCWLMTMQAKLTGKWTVGAGLAPYIGEGYRYAQAKRTSFPLATSLVVPEAGKYELRAGHGWATKNRTTRASCTLETSRPTTAEAATKTRREDAEDPQGLSFRWVNLIFPAGTSAVILSTEGGRRVCSLPTQSQLLKTLGVT